MKRAVLLILLILTATFLSADEKKHGGYSANQPTIESCVITPNPVGKGDLFTLTIIVDHNNSAEVDFPLKDLPENLLLWRGPYIRSFVDTDKDGYSLRKVRITTTLKAQKSGRMIFPSLSVIADNRELRTEPDLLRVGLYKNRKLYMPIEVEWQTEFDKIYAGEAVPLSLMVLNQENVAIFDSARVAYPRDGFFEEAEGVSEITSITEGDIILYDIPAATYILTSPVAGEVKIPSSGVEYEGVAGWTDNLFLKINRIPSEISESGAVGIFNFTASIDRESAVTGENIALTVSVSGDGNLNYLKLPEPSTEGCILVSSEVIDNYKPSPYGFTGSKTVSWLFTAENPGVSKISIPDFNFLNKTADRVESVRGTEFTITVYESSAEDGESESQVFPFEKIDTADTPAWKNYYRSYFRYAWLLPGFIFFLLALIMKGKRLPLAGVLSLIILIAVFSIGRFVIGADRPENAGIRADVLYNDALDAYATDDLTGSLHNLRAAIYHDPVNRLYRQTLSWIETENGFVNSVSPSPGLHPDIFYYILIISLNLLFFALVLRIVKSGGGVSVMMILFGSLIIFSAIMIGYSHISRERQTAIICAESSSLKKIPRETAEDWVPMNVGTDLRILGESDGFILVETGLGVKGWITESCILRDR